MYQRDGIFSEPNTGRGVKRDALRSTECHRYQSRIPAGSCFKFNCIFHEIFGVHRYGFWCNCSTLNRYLRLSFGESNYSGVVGREYFSGCSRATYATGRLTEELWFDTPIDKSFCFSSPKRSDRMWAHPVIYSMGAVMFFFSGYKPAGA